MSKKTNPIDQYITLEDALPKIYRWCGELRDARDAIRNEIIETGRYYRDSLQFEHQDGTIVINESILNDWIDERRQEKKEQYYARMREKYPFFKSNLEFLMYQQGEYTPSKLATALQENFNIEIKRSGIGNYLTHDTYNIPERDTMFAMAKQFDCTTEALGEVDIKSLHEKATSAQNYSVTEEDIKFLYPILYTNHDISNENFYNGIDKYYQLRNHQTTSQEFYFNLQCVMESFWNAGEEGVHYGYTNWITMFFIGYDYISVTESDMGESDSVISKNDFLEKNLPLLNQSLLILKRDGRYTELVHYFLARQLMFGLIKTIPTGNPEQQLVGGWTMMLALASVKNPFAERFVNANKSFWSFLLE